MTSVTCTDRALHNNQIRASTWRADLPIKQASQSEPKGEEGMDDAHTEETAPEALEKQQEWLINYLQNADDCLIEGLLYFCKRNKLLMYREPPEDTHGEAY